MVKKYLLGITPNGLKKTERGSLLSSKSLQITNFVHFVFNTLRCKIRSNVNFRFAFSTETRKTLSLSSEARRNQTSILIRGQENHVSP